KARTTMSTPAPPPDPRIQAAAHVPPHPVPGVGTSAAEEIRIISHSKLFYWWPVWAVGFLMGLLTFIDGHRMILVPSADPNVVEVSRTTTVVTSGSVDPITGRQPTATREAIVIKGKDYHLLPDKFPDPSNPPVPLPPKLHMASSSSYGVVWAT